MVRQKHTHQSHALAHFVRKCVARLRRAALMRIIIIKYICSVLPAKHPAKYPRFLVVFGDRKRILRKTRLAATEMSWSRNADKYVRSQLVMTPDHTLMVKYSNSQIGL